MLCFRLFGLILTALLLALPHHLSAAPLLPGPSVNYELTYTGSGTGLTAYGTGTMTISYMDEGNETVSGSVTAFNLSLTFTQTGSPFASSVSSYGLGDLDSYTTVLADGSATAPSLEYFLLESTDQQAKFDLAYPGTNGSLTYPDPYSTSGSVSLAPEPSTFGFMIGSGLLLVVTGLVRRRLPLGTLSLLALALTIPLRADVVFGNLTGSLPPGTPVTGSNYGMQSLAASFVPASDYSLTQAVAQLDWDGMGGQVEFSIYSNDPLNNVPLTDLDDLGFASVPEEGRYTVQNEGNSLILLASEEYWLVLSPRIPQTFVGWEFGGSPSTSGAVDDLNSGWENLNGINSFQFQIEGTPVSVSAPEPASASLVLGALGMVGLRRCRRHSSAKQARS